MLLLEVLLGPHPHNRCLPIVHRHLQTPLSLELACISPVGYVDLMALEAQVSALILEGSQLTVVSLQQSLRWLLQLLRHGMEQRLAPYA